MERTISLIIRVFLVLLSAQQIQADAQIENTCDVDFVNLDGASVVVSPTESNDTDNIQCALNSAIEQDIAMVQLAEGNISI